MSGDDDGLLRNVASYYTRTIETYGTTAKGVDWNGDDSHQLRHRQFLRLLGDDLTASVIDLGCGFGDFYRFLNEAGHSGAFTGYDVSEAMITAAIRQHRTSPQRNWIVGSVPSEAASYAVASGIFNVKGEIDDATWLAYVHRTIETLARASQRGFAFNMLSLSSDPERRQPHLFYADPAGMLEFCLSHYGRRVALLQDYGLYEFTIIVRHKPG